MPIVQQPDLYPYRAIASLVIPVSGGVEYGSAFFIGPYTLLTAGHCVYLTDSGYVNNMTVISGRSGVGSAVAGVTPIIADIFVTVAGWASSSPDTGQDYGAIFLNEPVGSTVGWFGYAALADGDLAGSNVNVAGYPASAAQTPDQRGGTQWYDADTVDHVDDERIYYSIDTASGESGAPIYQIQGNSRVAVGIHCYQELGAGLSFGTRITAAVVANLDTWAAWRPTS